MPINPVEILSVLDQCCDSFTFPMLDNGYVYLAATRLSLYRSSSEWALVIEVFGFSPRAYLPDTAIYTFASQLAARKTPDQYVNREAHQRYLANNPNNDLRFVHPIEEGPWQDAENIELLAEDAKEVVVRQRSMSLPSLAEYSRHGIELEQAPRVAVFEFCRYLADVAREQVLATPEERRVNVRPELKQIIRLEEWHHPNVVDSDDRPSGSKTFRQLAQVLATGDVKLYRPFGGPNTHWRNWPDGGRL
jgi:hypothetical protein